MPQKKKTIVSETNIDDDNMTSEDSYHCSDEQVDTKLNRKSKYIVNSDEKNIRIPKGYVLCRSHDGTDQILSIKQYNQRLNASGNASNAKRARKRKDMLENARIQRLLEKEENEAESNKIKLQQIEKARIQEEEEIIKKPVKKAPVKVKKAPVPPQQPQSTSLLPISSNFKGYMEDNKYSGLFGF